MKCDAHSVSSIPNDKGRRMGLGDGILTSKFSEREGRKEKNKESLSKVCFDRFLFLTNTQHYYNYFRNKKL